MERELQRLVRLFERAEMEVEVRLADAQRETSTTAARRRKQREIAGVLSSLRELTRNGNLGDPSGPVWNLVRAAYRQGSDRALRDMGAGGVNTAFGGIHQDAAEQLYAALNDRLDDAVGYMGRKADDVFRNAALRESLSGQVGGRTTRDTGRAIADRLREMGVGAFTGSRGREWGLKSYGEMAARTTGREAHTYGTLNRAAENGFDVVEITEHAGSCDLCEPFEGRRFSISGEHPDLPRLEEAPPYHPNCAHLLLVVSRERAAA